MYQMTLRMKFTLMGVAVLAGVLALAYTGHAAVDRLLRLAQLENVTAVIRHHMELDMMHDAIHGDGLNAVAALQNKSADKIAKAKKDLEEHLSVSEENITALKKLEVSKETQDAYATLEPEFLSYGKQAVALIDTIAADLAQGTTRSAKDIEDFEAEFEKLEGMMSTTSDKVQDWSQQIKQEGMSSAEAVRQQILIALIVSIALAMLAPLYARLALFRPLAKLEKLADQLAHGEYEIEIPGTGRSDEIGRLAKALDALRLKAAETYTLKHMVDDMPLNIMTADPSENFAITYNNNASKQTLQKLQRHLFASANGTQTIDMFYKDPAAIRALLTDPKNLPHQTKITLGDEVLDLKISAVRNAKSQYLGPMISWSLITQSVQLANTFEKSIGQVSEDISASAGSLNQSALSLQGAIEELSITAADISRRVHESLRIVHEASTKGEEAQNSMHHLSQSADKVSNVVTLIQQIAEKTNLLALNATIESARAGEAGKGFAVVANEVKTLATQTGNAITEIRKQVEEMHDSAEQAVKTVQAISGTIHAINQFASDVATSVEQQQAATAEIAKNICGTAKDGTGNAGTVLGLASRLSLVSNDLKSECTAFLEKARKM